MGLALVLHPDGELYELNLPTDTRARLRAKYATLDCSLVDVVQLTTKLDMWIDDEGLITNRPINGPATCLARHYGHTVQPYAGPVLLCGVDPLGNSIDLDRDQIIALLTRLADIAAD